MELTAPACQPRQVTTAQNRKHLTRDAVSCSEHNLGMARDQHCFSSSSDTQQSPFVYYHTKEDKYEEERCIYFSKEGLHVIHKGSNLWVAMNTI